MDWISKAFDKGADSVILDLEDSIAKKEKVSTREALFLHLKENKYEVNLIVRVNSIDEDLGIDDIKRLNQPDLDIEAFMLPKIEDPQKISNLPEINVIALLETPKSIKNIYKNLNNNKLISI